MGCHASSDEDENKKEDPMLQMACLDTMGVSASSLFEMLKQHPVERLALFVRLMTYLEASDRLAGLVWLVRSDYITLVLPAVQQKRLTIFVGVDSLQTQEETLSGDFVGRITHWFTIDDTLETQLTYEIGRLSM